MSSLTRRQGCNTSKLASFLSAILAQTCLYTVVHALQRILAAFILSGSTIMHRIFATNIATLISSTADLSSQHSFGWIHSYLSEKRLLWPRSMPRLLGTFARITTYLAATTFFYPRLMAARSVKDLSLSMKRLYGSILYAKISRA
jgi:hypothetical protein